MSDNSRFSELTIPFVNNTVAIPCYLSSLYFQVPSHVQRLGSCVVMRDPKYSQVTGLSPSSVFLCSHGAPFFICNCMRKHIHFSVQWHF